MTETGVARDREELAPPRRVASESRLWFDATLTAFATGYLVFTLTLLGIALLPTIGSWNSYLVRSGSMAPAIEAGDVVVASPLAAAQEVPVGRVMVFIDPSHPNAKRLLVHRVLSMRDDGTFTTAGDANRQWDTTALARTGIVGLARLRVPWVGLPILWWSRHDFGLLAGWLVITGIAIEVVWRSRRGGQQDSGDLTTRVRSRWHFRALTRSTMAITLLMAGNAAAARFSGDTFNPGNAWALSTRIVLPYKTNILSDAPWVYYETEEASGTTATDSSGNARTGSYGGTITYRQAGALTRLRGYSVMLASNNPRLVANTATTITNPTTYTLELWFKSTTSSGGKLVGFENTKNANSGTADRYVFMRNDGRLVFGGWINGGTKMITSPIAYNDGQWHMLVVTARPISGSTQQSANMYVDGSRVATGNTTTVSNYSGYWRAGYGAIARVSGAPSSNAFIGSIDNFAVYLSELTASRIEIHYASR